MIEADAVARGRTDYRCSRGNRCSDRVRDTETGEWAGAELRAVAGLCRICGSRGRDAVTQLPTDYAELSMLLAPSRTGAGTPISGTRERPVPIRLGVEALMAEIDAEVSWWAESVLDSLGAADVAWANDVNRKRPGARVDYGARILRYYWHELLTLPTQLHVVHDDGRHEYLERDGLDAADVILNLHQRVAALAGRTDRVTRLPAPCPKCHTTALVRANGAENITCRCCSAILRPDEYTALVSVLAADWQGAA